MMAMWYFRSSKVTFESRIAAQSMMAEHNFFNTTFDISIMEAKHFTACLHLLREFHQNLPWHGTTGKIVL